MSYDPNNTSCGRCGAPTRIQVVKGLNVQACVSCGAYTLDQLTLERLLGGPSSHWGATPDPASYRESGAPVYSGAPTIPAPPPPPPALPGELPDELPAQSVPTYRPTPLPAPQQAISNPPVASNPPAASAPVASPAPYADPGRQEPARERGAAPILLALSVVAIAGVALIVAGLVLIQGVAIVQPAARAPETVTPTDLNEVLAEEKAAEQAADEAATPEPDAAPSPPPAPAVTVEAAEPAPAPAPVRRDPVRSLIDRGWSQVGSNLTGATQAFKKALDLNPSHPDANYGYGYALLQQGNPSGARPHLCTALSSTDVEVRREATSMLKINQLSCD